MREIYTLCFLCIRDPWMTRHSSRDCRRYSSLSVVFAALLDMTFNISVQSDCWWYLLMAILKAVAPNRLVTANVSLSLSRETHFGKRKELYWWAVALLYLRMFFISCSLLQAEQTTWFGRSRARSSSSARVCSGEEANSMKCFVPSKHLRCIHDREKTTADSAGSKPMIYTRISTGTLLRMDADNAAGLGGSRERKTSFRSKFILLDERAAGFGVWSWRKSTVILGVVWETKH